MAGLDPAVITLAVNESFIDGLHVALTVAAAFLIVAAVVAATTIPRHRARQHHTASPDTANHPSPTEWSLHPPLARGTAMSSTSYPAHQVAVARRRARQLHAFRGHLSVYAVVIALLAVTDVAHGAGWWVGWVAFGWGIGIAAHAINVAHPTSRDEWVQRETEELLERN